MSYRIRLQPSGRHFLAEAGETVLEAALRHGVPLDYNCSSGTCGRCRAQLLEGQLGEVEFHDFVFSAAEKGQGWFLACRAHAGSDLTLAAAAAHSGDDIPPQRIATRVTKLERFDNGVAILHLRTPRTQTLRFLAGQAVMLTLESGSRRVAAIASCPCNGMLLQFHFRRQRGDPFLATLFQQVGRGTPVELYGPCGHFTLDESSNRPLLLIAEDTGFAPLRSLLEHALALELSQPIRLLRLAGPGGHYLDNLCRAWQDAIDNVSYRPLPRADGDYRLLRQQVDAWLAQNAPADIYLAGTPLLYAALGRYAAAGHRVYRYVTGDASAPCSEA